MDLAKIIIKGIRCFDELEIDLSKQSSDCKWTMLLGENGVGKTTILRSIALGLCDESNVSGLLQDLWGSWLKEKYRNSGSIYIEFKKERGQVNPFYIKTDFKLSHRGALKIEREFSRKFPWEKIFICGYGASRSSMATRDYNEYFQLKHPEIKLDKLGIVQNMEVIKIE